MKLILNVQRLAMITRESNLKKVLRLVRRFVGGEKRNVLFDIRNSLLGVDLRPADNSELGTDPKNSVRYASSASFDMYDILKTLNIRSTDSIIDIGCGKGGAMILFSRLPFAVVDGLELSKDLCVIAASNFKKLGLERLNVFNCDATLFQDLDKYSFIYMYNPFPSHIFKVVLGNIGQSISRRPRDVTLVYCYPACEADVIECGVFTKTAEIRKEGFPATAIFFHPGQDH